MQTEFNTEKDTAPAITCTAPWRLAKIKPLANYKLEVEFVDGTRGVIDMQNLILSKQAGVFIKLKDSDTFNKVYIEHGTPTWPCDVDLAPDAIYNDIKNKGHCSL